MVLCLREGGLLLLAVPTCSRDLLLYPWHRVYGPNASGSSGSSTLPENSRCSGAYGEGKWSKEG